MDGPASGRRAGWPVGERLLVLAALLIIGLVAVGRFGGHGGQVLPAGTEARATTGPPVATTSGPDPVTTTTEPPAPTSTTAVVVVTTEAASGTPPPARAPQSPGITVPRLATPTTVLTFCGFAPGSVVAIQLNGQASGQGTADSEGCIVIDW